MASRSFFCLLREKNSNLFVADHFLGKVLKKKDTLHSFCRKMTKKRLFLSAQLNKKFVSFFVKKGEKQRNAQSVSGGTSATPTRTPRFSASPATSTPETNEPFGNAEQSLGEFHGSWKSTKPRCKDEPKCSRLEVVAAWAPARRLYIRRRI
jgi:hypothetical protein